MDEDERKFKDLNSQNKRKRKEPAKPWGKRERILILILLILTVGASGFLALSSRNYKLPNLPRLSFTWPNLNPFKEGTIIIGRKDTSFDKEKLKAQAIIKGFEEKTKSLSGVYALYVLDLSTGFSFGVNENEVMQAASLIKLPLMLYADGKVGDAKIEAMGKRSDNAVFNELVTKFGKDNLQKYIDNLGMANTSLENNETIPKEIGDLFQKIYTDKNEKILGFLTDTIFENWLVAGIPQEVRVAHKYGREVHVVNDAGIVFSGKPFVLVIMTDGVIEREADAIFPELARGVYLGLSSGL
jgi:beta-lactamase class A